MKAGAATASLALVLLASCSPPPPLGVFNTVPDFRFTAHTGEEFASTRELTGRVWIADFIYTTCPGPCPRMSRQMSRVQEALHDLPEIRLVSFTVDPKNDTPEVLAAYAKRYGAQPGRWFFLTGDRQELHNLSLKAFMLGSISGTLDHSTRFVLVDRRNRVRQYYGTNEGGAIDRLIADARRLYREKTGS